MMKTCRCLAGGRGGRGGGDRGGFGDRGGGRGFGGGRGRGDFGGGRGAPMRGGKNTQQPIKSTRSLITDMKSLVP